MHQSAHITTGGTHCYTYNLQKKTTAARLSAKGNTLRLHSFGQEFH